MDGNRMATPVKELTDAEVFGTAAPRELTDAEVFGAEHGKTSQALGFLEGGAQALAGYRKLNPLNLLLPPGQNEEKARANVKALFAAQHAKGVKSGLLGEMLGGAVGTAPTMAFGGGVGGALTGAITSDKKDILGVAGDALIGAVGGKAGEKVVGAAQKALAPTVKPVIQRLLDAGVTLTPGQILGGALKSAEQKMTSWPVIGGAIRAAEDRGLDSFNRAAITQTLDPIGVKLPDHINTGHDAVDFAQKAVGHAYDTLLPGLKIAPDVEFGNGLRALAPEVASLPAPRQKQLQAILKNATDKLSKGDGVSFKAAQSDIGRLIRQYSGSQDGDQRGMALVLASVQDEMQDMLVRQNPAAEAPLKAANLAYATLVRIENAAGRAGSADGAFTPAALKGATRAEDKSLRKKASASGDALLQQFAEDGKAGLGKVVPDSGTAGRQMSMSIPAVALGAGVSPLAMIYSPAGQKALTALLTKRGSSTKAIANMLEQMRLPAAHVGANLPAASRGSGR